MKRNQVFEEIYKALCGPVPYGDDGAIQLAYMAENILKVLEEKLNIKWKEGE